MKRGVSFLLKTVLVVSVLVCAADCAEGRETGGTDDAEIWDGGEQTNCVRWVFVDEVVNARNLGGQPLLENRNTLCEKIFRGGDLTQLSDEGCAKFDEMGIRTVVDLRMEDIQQSQPPPDCVSENANMISAAMPKLIDTPENYLILMRESEAITNVFERLGDSEAYPIYIHCVIGRDRASFVTALILLALGAGRKTVVDEFRLSEERGVHVKVECIEAVLDEVDRLGGIELFLESVGVNATQLGVLREQTISE